MNPYYYDLHIHSCLSPCGDEDMTPNNIVNMALLKELDLIALTDHNSCKNCPAILAAARGKPITVLPGMELNTAEEVHVVCLFPDLERAMAFDTYVHDRLLPIPNEPEIFGRQLILNEQDESIGEEPLLLISAADISVDSVPRLMQQFGGIAFPAHINRSSSSMLSAFGSLPAREMGYHAVEVYQDMGQYTMPLDRRLLDGLLVLLNSDAHYLQNIAEPEHALLLESCGFEGLRRWMMGQHV